MKKILLTLAVLLGLGFIATQVIAWGPGHGQGYWGQNGGAHGSGYYDGNDALRQKLSDKIAEYDALVNQKNPDPKRLNQLSREISELRNQLRNRNRNYRTPYHSGPHGPYCGWSHGYCW